MSDDELNKIILDTIQLCTGLTYGSKQSLEYMNKIKEKNGKSI
jgi:hypothetical protein